MIVKMKIKICGLKRPEDVTYVNEAGPDYAGFVFAGTKRKIDLQLAKSLKEQLNTTIPSVGVFVNENINNITKIVSENVIDIVQLHGDEDAEYIKKLCDELGEISLKTGKTIPIIKAIRVKTKEQILEAEKLNVDYLLLDAFQKNEYGGSGKVFDYKLIPQLSKPYFLAGGISVDNILPILTALKEKNNLPYGVDVSSSVETEGIKDEKKIQEIVRLVHSMNL